MILDTVNGNSGTLIYLTLIAIGGILALLVGLGSEAKEILSQWPLQCCLPFPCFLTIICSGVSLLGGFYIYRYHRNIEKYRDRKDQLQNHLINQLEDTIRSQVQTCFKKNKGEDNDWRWFVIPFWAVIAFAWFLGICLIWTIN